MLYEVITMVIKRLGVLGIQKLELEGAQGLVLGLHAHVGDAHGVGQA